MAVIHQQFDFSGGLFTKLGPHLIPPNCAYKLQNAMVHKGGFRKIYGTTKLNATKIGDVPITSLYRAYVGAFTVFFATAGTVMYYWDGDSWESLKTGLTADKPWSFVTYNGVVYCTNGTNTPQKITITQAPSAGAPAIADMTGPPQNCKQFIVARERLWSGVTTTTPDRVWYCGIGSDGIGTPEVWTASDYLSFPSESSDERVAGMAVWKNNPVIFTENTISLILGNNDYEFETPTLDSRHGCIAQRSIQEFGENIIFLGRNGIYAFNGGEAVLISENIQPEIDDFNPTYIQNAVAVADELTYNISYVSTAATGAINNRTLIFDIRLGDIVNGVIKGGWTGPHTIGAASFSYWKGASDKGEIYYGDATSTGFIHKYMDSTSKSFSGSNITMLVQTGAIDFSDFIRFDQKKFPEELITIAEPEGDYDLTASYALDNASSFTSLATINLATSGKEAGDRNSDTVSRTIIVYPAKFTGNLTCYFIQLQFQQIGTAAACVVRGYILSAIQATPTRERR